MDLINKKDWEKTCDFLADNKELNKESLRELCLILATSCTPYLGYHKKTEEAFESFVKCHEKRGAA